MISASVPDASLDGVLAGVSAGALAGNGVGSGEGGGVIDGDGVEGGVRYEARRAGGGEMPGRLFATGELCAGFKR